jgi:hypothetical protein
VEAVVGSLDEGAQVFMTYQQEGGKTVLQGGMSEVKKQGD